MEKRYIAIVAVAMVAGAAWPTSNEIVEEYFEGSQFPPEGWRMSGSWRWGSEAGNRFAAGSQVYNGASVLYTYEFELYRGTPVTLLFEYRARWWETGRHDVEVRLRYGSGTVWYQALGFPSTWTIAGSSGIQIPETRTDYYCQWTVATLGYAITWLDVDNVIVKLENTGVEATSLGRVRALYR